MRNRFDQLAKQIGQEALGPSGTTVARDEISPDAQHADLRHEPDPKREAERARLGLSGRLAAVVCLIEIYGHAPDAATLDRWIDQAMAAQSVAEALHVNGIEAARPAASRRRKSRSSL